MSEAQASPVSVSDRIEIIDILRGLAVGGILIGNMQWFSGYGMMPPAMVENSQTIDKVVTFFVHFFIEGKFYSIFSFLFGFGFALQIARATERGDTKATLFKRRLFWLLVIGLIHAYVLWPGDILSIYAVMGFILLLFRNKSDASLLKWAVGLMIVPIVTYLLLFGAFLAFAPPDVGATVDAGQAEFWNSSVETVGNGSFWQIMSTYNPGYIIGRYMGLIFQMRLPKILAMFLLGFYAYRIGVFQNLKDNAPLVKRVLIYGLILGVVGNLIMTAAAGNEGSFPPSAMGVAGVVGYAFGVPALALGIVALLTTLWKTDLWKRVLGIFAPVGRMALTNYLTQTLACVMIFYGYGLGKFGTFTASQATLTALAIFAVQTVVSTVWLKFFTFGPMEWIWRQLTYGKRLPLRLKA
ncbi:MAG: DUF418 domain-containing protein [Acidobacteria bacterium]|nr:DUF418 domain-containing protein [Acidobacteriota bacterium]MBP7475368.1 DUF418 domain-containing protein [Pyrinomonadaceae bacterium]MBP9108740.1 DUF418 domain-containing protein [Pyrinomonadaceae bacterium]